MKMAAFRLALAAALVCCLLPSSRCTLSLASTAMSASPSPSSTASAMTTAAITETISPSPVPSPSTTVTSPTSPVVSPTKTSSPVVSPTKTSPTPPPTASPSPSIEPKQFLAFWQNGIVCANVTGSAVLQFTYRNTKDQKKTVDLLAMDPRWNATVDFDQSFCNNETVKLVILFRNDSNYNHTFTLTFDTTGPKEYGLKKIGAILDLKDPSLFPGFNSTAYGSVSGTTNEKNDIFSSSRNRSYECKTVRKFTMTITPKDAGESLVLRLSHFQAQAFSFSHPYQGDFDKVSHCSLDQKTSKVVPIAVGAALAGLVVVVLIAYLIGRFRSRKQNSYEALS